VANPTTNYGFVLPTSSDLVTDLPADFDVALQGVDTRLKALQPGTTLGDLAYSSATANTNTRLGIGSTGNVLTVAGGVPTWAAPAAGGGKVLQVVSAVTTTQTSIASTTLADTTITASITPTASTSKILVIVNAEFFNNRLTTNTAAKARLLRGATTIVDYPDDTFQFINAGGASSASWAGILPVTYLDSPATTSSTTYKLQGAVQTTANSCSVTFQYSSSPSTITLLEIGA
jgi:hypothetical protein